MSNPYNSQNPVNTSQWASTPINQGGTPAQPTFVATLATFSQLPSIQAGQAVGSSEGYWVALVSMSPPRPLPIGIVYQNPEGLGPGGLPSHGPCGSNQHWHFSQGYSPAGGLT